MLRPSWVPVSLVDALPVESVIEAPSTCADRVGAEAMLSASLSAARGPRRASDGEGRWRLTVSVTAAAPGIKAADARIVDDGGRVVAERTVSDKTVGSCVALVRAVGAWAQIVLDDELMREHDAEERRERERGDVERRRREPPETSPVVLASTAGSQPGGEEGAANAVAPRTGTLDVGTMLFLRNGAAATGGMFGLSVFGALSVSGRWVLRPSVMYGTSTSRVPPDQSNSENLTSVGGRLDVCRRISGNYIDRRGIELDACMGGDATHVWSALESVGRGSLGPSAILRGEIGQGVSLEIRSIVGVNLNRSALGGQELPPLVAAAELGGSVRFR